MKNFNEILKEQVNKVNSKSPLAFFAKVDLTKNTASRKNINLYGEYISSVGVDVNVEEEFKFDQNSKDYGSLFYNVAKKEFKEGDTVYLSKVSVDFDMAFIKKTLSEEYEVYYSKESNKTIIILDKEVFIVNGG